MDVNESQKSVSHSKIVIGQRIAHFHFTPPQDQAYVFQIGFSICRTRYVNMRTVNFAGVFLCTLNITLII